MKLADAQMLLKLEKEKGPLTERWWCETDEGILLEAWPLGFARGSFKFSDCFTVIPRYQYSALFQGGPAPHHLRINKRGVNGSGLWEQEYFVYLKEMRAAMRKALEDLEDAPYAPRKKEHHNLDRAAYPEDFKPGGIKTQKLQKEKSLLWGYGGIPDVSIAELGKIKSEFCELLNRFVTQGELNGQRQTV